MRLASFVMMRNEHPVLNAFCDQLETFFDKSYVIDHNSDDGSTAIVRSRDISKITWYKLVSDGYPQSEIATSFARGILESGAFDWLFFLDCDEFLPFANRDELERALVKFEGQDFVYLNWRNVVPCDLGGGNIFKQRFMALPTVSAKYAKIALSPRALKHHPRMTIWQGYHGLSNAEGAVSACLHHSGLYHIPIQSRIRFLYKISTSAQRLIAEGQLYRAGLGAHWVNYYEYFLYRGVENFDFNGVGLHYSDPPPKRASTTVELNFDFPYIRSSYEEQTEFILHEIPRDHHFTTGKPGFVVTTPRGEVVLSSAEHRVNIRFLQISSEAKQQRGERNTLEESNERKAERAVEIYSSLYAPLFALPLKLPRSKSEGHVPFQFSLIRTMRPRVYLELGVDDGATLIAAATAAKAYRQKPRLLGVNRANAYGDDPLSSDEIARINQLSEFCSSQFIGVELDFNSLDAALERIPEGALDILAISGLQSGLKAADVIGRCKTVMSSDAVILIFGIANRGAKGELENFVDSIRQDLLGSLTFSHSEGLAVLFTGESSRTSDLLAIARDPIDAQVFTSLVSDMGLEVRGRMNFLEAEHDPRGWPGSARRAVDRAESELATTRAYADALELEAAALRVRLGAGESGVR